MQPLLGRLRFADPKEENSRQIMWLMLQRIDKYVSYLVSSVDDKQIKP
jgi:hypothetical protein